MNSYKRKAPTDSDTENEHDAKRSKLIGCLVTEAEERKQSILEVLPYEILVRILSYLGAKDVTSFERCSKYFRHLANDPLIWKRLLQREFPSRLWRKGLRSTTLQQRKSFKTLYKISTNWKSGNAKSSTVELRSSLLDHRLPIECQLSKNNDDHQNCQREKQYATTSLPQSFVQFYQHFIFTASKVHESRDAQNIPGVNVFINDSDGNSRNIAYLQSSSLEQYFKTKPHLLSRKPIRICDMRLDEASLSIPPPTSTTTTSMPASTASAIEAKRLAVFYSSGQYVIFWITLHTNEIEWKEEYSLVKLAKDEDGDEDIGQLQEGAFHQGNPSCNVVLSKFWSPLLVTFTKDFQLGIWVISTERDPITKEPIKTNVELSQPALKSHACWWPAVLSLSQQKANQSFKVTLAYAMPFYPSLWSVGVQEFNIVVHSKEQPSSHTTVSTSQEAQTRRISVTTRRATALPASSTASTPVFARNTSISTPSPSSHSPSPSLSYHQQIIHHNHYNPASSALVTSIEYSDPWLVTSRSDNTIQVFRVVSTSSSQSEQYQSSEEHHRKKEAMPRSIPSRPMQVSHYQTLFGHTASVETVSLDTTGRCVSGGADGKVKVWSLSNTYRKHSKSKLNVPTFNNVDVIEHYGDENLNVNQNSNNNLTRISPVNRIKWLGFDHSKIVTLVSPIVPPLLPSSLSSSSVPSPSSSSSSSHSIAHGETVKIFNFD